MHWSAKYGSERISEDHLLQPSSRNGAVAKNRWCPLWLFQSIYLKCPWMGDPTAFLENVGLVQQHLTSETFSQGVHSEPPKLQTRAAPLCCATTTESLAPLPLAFQSNSWRLFPAHKIPFPGSVPGLGPWPACSPPCFPAGLDWCKGSSPYMLNISGSSPQAPHCPSPQDPSELPPCHLNYSSCSRIIHKPTGSTVTVFFWLWLPKQSSSWVCPLHIFSPCQWYRGNCLAVRIPVTSARMITAESSFPPVPSLQA